MTTATAETPTSTTDYAVCTSEGCGVPLPTPEHAREHSKTTMTPTGTTSGVTARGHSYSVLNPTREEVVRSKVGYEIERATERAYEELDREIDAGRLTRAEVTQELRHYSDFADGWAEWYADEEDEEEGDAAANEADDQLFLPWRDDNPKHRPVWRDESRMWHCTCGKATADRLRHIRHHADMFTAKGAA